MSGPLTEAGWRDLYVGIERVLGVHDTASQRRALIPLARAYRRLDDAGRASFLRSAAADLGVEPDEVRQAAQALLGDPSDTGAQVALRKALTPRFADLLHLLTGLPGGVKLLVDLRADLRHLVPGELPMVEHELDGHLATVFDVGLLRLERITWQSPAELLEKLIEYEAVHEIQGWDDLRDRLDADRRCFAFLHPAMPGEPVVFVEIALTVGTPETLGEVLDRTAPRSRPEEADTAVFYSITSCQPGLAGINLGNELLKTVVVELRRELGNLDRFVTLSPIPSLREADLDLPDAVRERLGDPAWLAGPDDDLRSAVLTAAARYLTTFRGAGCPTRWPTSTSATVRSSTRSAGGPTPRTTASSAPGG
ncbi:MAG: malonyl-CoA decarboxylase domain-containing protein [Acidimicrobiia bacterium]